MALVPMMALVVQVVLVALEVLVVLVVAALAALMVLLALPMPEMPVMPGMPAALAVGAQALLATTETLAKVAVIVAPALQQLAEQALAAEAAQALVQVAKAEPAVTGAAAVEPAVADLLPLQAPLAQPKAQREQLEQAQLLPVAPPQREGMASRTARANNPQRGARRKRAHNLQTSQGLGTTRRAELEVVELFHPKLPRLPALVPVALSPRLPAPLGVLGAVPGALMDLRELAARGPIKRAPRRSQLFRRKCACPARHHRHRMPLMRSSRSRMAPLHQLRQNRAPTQAPMRVIQRTIHWRMQQRRRKRHRLLTALALRSRQRFLRAMWRPPCGPPRKVRW